MTAKLKKPIKNLLIFGDSHSTFEGFVPEGYKSWYGGEGGTPEKTDVFCVEDCWWYQLAKELDLNIVRNDSWSGSTIGFSGYNGEDQSSGKSFIARLEKLEEKGLFNKTIDTVLILGGINDSCANAPLGEVKLDNFVRDDFYFVLPAIGFFVSKLKTLLPNANIIFMIHPTLKPEIANAVKVASDFFDIRYFELIDIAKQSGHPNILGMSQIKEQIKNFLLEN